MVYLLIFYMERGSHIQSSISSLPFLQISEYWIIRRGHVRVSDVYDTQRDGWYWYSYGINWRAYTAYICGILINVVGFAGAGTWCLSSRYLEYFF